jgi:glycosyltransferase involved in cell wall biosynthesis
LSNPLVSVVIPLFNKEQWITQTLLSVYSQTYPNWECHIIDDGSTDGSLEIVNEFIDAHPGNWKVVSQINSGQIHARNFGIELSSGDFVAFLDADDLWLPRKIELQIEAHLVDPDLALSFTPYIIFKENQRRFFRVVSRKNSKKMIDDWLSMTGFGGLIESTGFIKRDVLETLGRYSAAYSMTSGLDLSLKAAAAFKVEVLKDPLVLYRLSPGQFHKQEDVLIRDLEVMTTKYADSPEALYRLRKFHSSYLYWSKCRSQGARYFAVSAFRVILLLRRRELPMLYFLLSRNLVATFRGFRKQWMIRQFLDRSSEK